TSSHLPSPENDRAATGTSLLWRSSSLTTLPVAASRTAALPSLPPLTSQRPSGEKARWRPSPLWTTASAFRSYAGAAAGAGGAGGTGRGGGGGTGLSPSLRRS